MEETTTPQPKKSQELPKLNKGIVPTTRQKKAFKALGENGGNITKAMIAADYAPSIVHATEKLTNSKGWKKLMESHLGDEVLAKKHKELLNAVNLEKLSFGGKDTDEEIADVVSKMEGYTLLYIKEITDSNDRVVDKYAYVKAPDNMAQDKALDKAYKLRGLYAAENDDEKPKSTNTTYNFIFSTPVQAKVKVMEDEIKQMLLKKHEPTQEN